jgi:hypothetical protein
MMELLKVEKDEDMLARLKGDDWRVQDLPVPFFAVRQPENDGFR